MRPKIFVTNDDGIFSPGLKAAVKAVMHLGDVVLVASTNQQTAMGRSMRGNKEDRLKEVEFSFGNEKIKGYHLDCSPGMAVQHGVNVLCHDCRPDLLISGINYGENLGNNATQSGTIGAALQGASMGIPSLAASFETDSSYHFEYGDVDWSVAEFFLNYFAAKVLNQKLPLDVQVLKVDVPASATPETPWRVTRVARQAYYRSVYENPAKDNKLGDGRLGVIIDKEILEPDSDIQAFVYDRIVSVSPLSLDLTSRTELKELSTMFSLPAPPRGVGRAK
ncbi:MAG: 5'/3'-nucleotidase SurE, partial [bacterium]|nr:5'/3'-nucleotidase SurE [bacterium]